MKAHLILAAGVGAALLSSLADPADAGRRRSAPEGYVTAESRNGNGSATGAVRSTGLGPQVQLPSGRWVYCRRSCSETLRVETVDANYNHGYPFGAGTLQAECGVFGCLDVLR
jgi:hypothetical protein